MAGISEEGWDEFAYWFCKASNDWPAIMCNDPQKSGADFKDLIADAEGGKCAGWIPVFVPIVGCFFDDSYNCCNRLFPQGNPGKNPPWIQ